MAEQINKINESLYQANIDLIDKNKKLESEIEKLKQRLEIEIDISDGMLKTIDRAIEYIKEYGDIENIFIPTNISYKASIELLEILKGVNNNE